MTNKEFKKEINIVIEMGIAEFAKQNEISLDDIINQTIEKADVLIKDLRPLNSVTFNLPINGCDCIWKIRQESIQVIPDHKGGNRHYYTFTLVDLRLTEITPDIWGVKRGDYYYFNKPNLKDILGYPVHPGEYRVVDDQFKFLGNEVIKVKPSLANPNNSIYIFNKLDFYDHFDTATLHEITIADTEGQYLLTDSEDKGWRIFAELIKDPIYANILSTIDLEEFKEKLIAMKEIE